MKIHRHLVQQVALALSDIFFGNRYADKSVEHFLGKNRKWGARDRRFFAESVYECVRWWRKLWYLIDEEPINNPEALMDLWAAWWLTQGHELPDWEEFDGLKKESIYNRNKQLKSSKEEKDIAIRESVPDWLYAWGAKECGDRWPVILTALNEKAPVDLRVNTLLTDREALKKNLQGEAISLNEIADVPTGLSLTERKNVFITEAYKKGFFEMQDRASQLVAPLLDPQPKDRIIDACAGAGGKSLHIAALMKNKGKIISMDVHEKKLNELRKRASRAKVDIIETKQIDSNKVIKRLEESADRVLLDVPCSAMGVLRRGPDTKWKLNPEELEKILQTQQQILSEYSSMVKKGGYLVYATCSIMQSENHGQIEKFLATNGHEWTLQKELNIFPDQNQGDGFFAALLQRKK
jgi:16S rRNA (cytosine967-C5)-methyltransferase